MLQHPLDCNTLCEPHWYVTRAALGVMMTVYLVCATRSVDSGLVVLVPSSMLTAPCRP